ncbi:FKBP-type peptidyl-prolyl cis-trans isomerase [Hymenobacter sp. BT175]|uniref:FKBP-type peptidyl-prolyl cis-trans isomerase n=1 Tax=Hymenobacter translucens TaxID=2886507 RepID=UPI001D0E8CAA|nr:FKBP-type peptidyl-prolyl cis-trans isomerase [Hymenobacter translucens]MCC2547533.1 FKBP-type peptidyl-prolyl cis-trans isomerase [Hymenobacter translucens]
MLSFPAAWSRLRVAPLLLLLLSLVSACTKEKDYGPIDEELIKQYISDQKLTGAVRLESGLYVVPVTTATGVQPRTGQTVSVLYTGMLLDGTVFDATSRRGNTPFDFTLGVGQVIQGWDLGIAQLNKGSKAILLIPSRLGYGPKGAGGGSIPPNAVLRFDVELVNVR